MLYNLHYLTKNLNLHTIVLPNFYDFDTLFNSISGNLPLLHIAKGRLGIVSDHEYKPEIVMNADAEWFMRQDKRLNHFIKSNHFIIADKILDNIRNKTPIDFTKGMITGILDEDVLADPKFREDEIFPK